MNNKQFLLTFFFSTGILFPQFLLGNKIASSVTLKSYLSQNKLETNLTVDFPVEEINLIPLSNDLLSEIIPPKNLPLSKIIEFQINPDQEQRAGLFDSLLDSLQQLEINQENNQIGQITVPILSQTDYSNIYQDIYDFETELTNGIAATPRNIRPNLTTTNPPQQLGTFRQEISSYNNISSRYQTRFLESNSTIPNQTSLNSFVSRNERRADSSSYYSSITNLVQQPYSITNILNLDSAINSITYNQSQSYNALAIPSRKIEIIQFKGISQPSIRKTPEQIELEKRLEKQRQKLKKRTERLRKKLEKQRQKREKEREKQRKKRLDQIAKQQVKLRKINF